MKITKTPKVDQSLFGVEIEECVDDRIKINTIVKLKSRNIFMRVEKIENLNVKTRWFEGEVLKKGIFEINELSFVK